MTIVKIESDKYDHVQAILVGDETAAELAVKYNLRCEVCVFLHECRSIVARRDHNSPFCFADSALHDRFLSYYGKRSVE